MLNQQAPEKRVISASGNLDVHSIFYTIQGEGPFCGTPAVFIRLAGCNLQCPGCDTIYTTGRRTVSPSAVVQAVSVLQERACGHDKPGLVVITGGEPFRQDLTSLINLLIDHNFYVQIETNGTLPAPADVPFTRFAFHDRQGCFIVCSPKTGRVHPSVAKNACAYKYVMHAGSVADDGLPILALDHTARPTVARPPAHWDRPIYLQPMDSQDPEQNARNRAVCVASCLKHGYILQLQIHKLLGME